MAVPQLVEQVGRVLDGRYRVTAPIGTGASAAVFLADDVTLRRRVALKLLHAGLANDPAFLRRFQAEARTAAGLSHPNIMRVLDWGESDETGPFLVLEYLGGGSLRAVLDRAETLTVSQALKVGLQAARALDYAHRRGLVHRDVKPGNLLFDDEARLAIADFGLARALAEAAWTEPGGAMLGTARYASPEQVRGRSLDGKSDVYALGLVLIEAVTGSVPFSADTTLATLMARLDAQVEAPEEMGALGPIVERATAPDPDDRIDAAELVTMLESAVASSPPAEPISLPGAIAIDITGDDELDRTMLPEGVQRPRVPLIGSAPVAPLGEAEAADDAKPEKVKRPRRRPRLRHVLLFLLGLVLVGALGTGGWALYYFTGSERPVPELSNVTLDQAQAIADNAGVLLAYDGEAFSETVPAGLTLEEAPAAGQSVHPRERVHITTSKGPAPRAVVSVVGQQLAAGQGALEASGFVVTTQNQFSETIARGQILAQNPSTGELAKGTTVALTVSQGTQPRTIPDVAGDTFEAASAKITALGLRVTRSDAFSDTIPAGQVSGTTPGPGASAQRDSAVAVLVSKGPDLVTVPNVIGQSVTSAAVAIEAAGFSVNNISGPFTGRVSDTNPGPGARVKRGSSVSLSAR